jgi:hypothetical protein
MSLASIEDEFLALSPLRNLQVAIPTRGPKGVVVDGVDVDVAQCRQPLCSLKTTIRTGPPKDVVVIRVVVIREVVVGVDV